MENYINREQAVEFSAFFDCFNKKLLDEEKKKLVLPINEVIHPFDKSIQTSKINAKDKAAEDLALDHREFGNLYMKYQNFHLAIRSYTDGLEAKCGIPDVDAVLYNNRSAAQFFLKNYRSALADAQKSLEYKPDYAKARWRAAQCAFKLERFDLCKELCEKISEDDPYNENAARELLIKNDRRKLEKEHEERKEATDKQYQIQRFQRLCNALKERNVKFHDHPDLTKDLLKPRCSDLADHAVHLMEDNITLAWPATFCYPEFAFVECASSLIENVTMAVVMATLLAKPHPCDKIKRYRPNTINLYYENRKAGYAQKVNLQKTIREILQEKSFFVSNGCLEFHVLRKNSIVEQMFIRSSKRNILTYPPLRI